MSVDGSTGKMNISRFSGDEHEPMGEEGTWTIFVYLCGTDLESEDFYGAATDDIIEMLNASPNDDVRFVIQTGGTSQWANELFSADASERYLITGGDIQLVDSGPRANMGDASTLTDFLKWGVTEYPAAKMGLVFWDHGGGSITGV
ncbi:MAG: Clostripain family protein, partial [Ruminiclostridium sp.]|nr:Clostripain family protein [Ruminiclostridium sp.]